jgi:four helix bundle protein
MADEFDLEERLLGFAARVIRIVEALPHTRAGNYIGGQVLRSGISPLLNHGEAQGAESRRDFVHKLSVCLKEVRETYRSLRLIHRGPLLEPPSRIESLIQESDELAKIFAKSIQTAEAKLERPRGRDRR